MLKVLLKKQIAELLHGLFYSRRTGKRNSTGKIVGLAILLVFTGISFMLSLGMLYFMLGMSFNGGSESLLELPLDPSGGAGSMYFSFTGIVTVIIGLIGGMFSTYSILYCPKDNELLLSMPIPPRTILAARMAGVYLLVLMYTVVSFIPAILIYFILFGFSILVLLRGLVMYVALTLVILALSCALGWILALIAAKLGGKKVVTVVSLIVSLGAYYFFYFQRSRIMNMITSDPVAAEKTFRTKLYPFYAYGSGTAENWLNFFIFLAIALAAMALAMFLLSRSFISLVTTKKSGRKKVYVAREASVNSAYNALLRREIRRFLTDPLYLINNGLGAVMMIAGGIILLVNTRGLRSLISTFPAWCGAPFLAVAMLIAIAFISSLTVITASTISLEGHGLWILQTLPLKAETILLSKATLHMIFAGIPAVFLAICTGIVIGLGWGTIVLALAALAFTALVCCLGLFFEVRSPKLDWTDESVAVKQNMNVLFAMLIGSGGAVVLGGIAIVLSLFLPVLAIPLLVFETAAFVGLSILFFRLSVKSWPRLCEVN